MMTTADPRVVAYLHRLEEAAAGLRPERRAELVAEIRDHIDTRLNDPGPATPGLDPVENALARLGEPEEIVAAAADEPGAIDPGIQFLATAPRRGFGGPEAAALILLLLGGFVFGVGWIVGVVLLWMSPRWTVREKLLGTLVWPGGLAAPLLVGGAATVLVARVEGCPATPGAAGAAIEQCTGGGVNVLAIVLMIAAVLAPIAVVAMLGVRASRRADWV